jgi:hypothetical protein
MTWIREGACSDCRGWPPALHGRCPSCGRSLSVLAGMLPQWLDRGLGAWLQRRNPKDLALRMACVPLVIPFPLLALLIFGLSARHEPGTDLLRSWWPVLVLALLNILLSAWLLSEAAESIVRFVLGWWGIMHDVIPQPPAPGPQPIPV